MLISCFFLRLSLQHGQQVDTRCLQSRENGADRPGRLGEPLEADIPRGLQRPGRHSDTLCAVSTPKSMGIANRAIGDAWIRALVVGGGEDHKKASL